MIKQFNHKGLEKLFETGTIKGVRPEHAPKLRRILALLETAGVIDDMDLPGLYLHELKGNRKGTWSVKVSGNWRVTFQIIGGDVYNIGYEDYH